MNTEDSPCCRRRLIARVTHRPLIDKVIRSSGGELFGAVVEARWVHRVHFEIRSHADSQGSTGVCSDFASRTVSYLNLHKYSQKAAKRSNSIRVDMIVCYVQNEMLCRVESLIYIIHLQPRPKETNHSNWGRPTLTQFCLSAIRDNII